MAASKPARIPVPRPAAGPVSAAHCPITISLAETPGSAATSIPAAGATSARTARNLVHALLDLRKSAPPRVTVISSAVRRNSHRGDVDEALGPYKNESRAPGPAPGARD